MMRPETGIAVQRVQQALLDLGYAIPSGATGAFLDETGAAVTAFKRDHFLVPDDPVIGPGTMSALDHDIVAFDASQAPPGAPGEPLAGSHCWVTSEGRDVVGDRRPGLLVEWRSSDSSREGRVVYLSQPDTKHWTVVEEWIPARLVTPA
jgi:peptidoglycan hydrolase-like protein with peptidoglycan-binding domain